MEITLNPTEKYFARTLFQNKIYSSEGNSFESLFVTIMGYKNTNFMPVKPQGPIGDRKNDGFDQTTGVYYQVYAPENPDTSLGAAIAKLNTDFLGLKDYWTKICPIKEYHFVFNDKYRGPYPTLFTELSTIQTAHSLSTCLPIIAKDLEEITFQLPDDQIFMVVGPIPNVENMKHVQIASIGNVIQYLIKNKKNPSAEQVMSAPDFSEKIEFNGLSDTKIGPLLNTASFQSSVVDDFFATQAAGLKQDTRDIFRKLYEEGKAKYSAIPDLENVADHIFFHILDNAYDDKRQDIQQAVLVLMAVYFESCDIFEEPKKAVSEES